MIRQLTPDDCHLLAPVMRTTWEQTYPEFCKEEVALLDKLFNIDTVRTELALMNQVFLGSFIQDNLVGYAKIKIEKPCSFLDKLYLDSSYQGQRLGSQLLTACFKHAQTASINSMKLYVVSTNNHAIAFYQKSGFKKLPYLVVFPTTGTKLMYDAVMICTNINAALELLDSKSSSQLFSIK